MHSHLLECIVDYGPLHGFWCFAFERFNGILGSMPNNNRSVEVQLMKRFLQENQVLTPPCDTHGDEFTSMLFPIFPKKVQSGSIADTVSAYQPTQSSSVCFSSIEVDCELPKFHHRYKLSLFQQTKLTKMYSDVYSVPPSDVCITETCVSYTSVKLRGKLFGCSKTRSAASSMVITKNPTSVEEKAARIETIIKHVANIHGEPIAHLLAHVSWFEPCLDTQLESPGKPVSTWFANDTCIGFIPFQFIISRAVTLVDDCNGQSVLFVTPCVEF